MIVDYQWIRNKVKQGSFSIVKIYVCVGIILYLFQTWLIFPGNRNLSQTPEQLGLVYENLNLSVGDETTNAWFVHGPDSRGVILYSHGNAESVSSCLPMAAIYRGLGFDVMLYDYGGYGRSTGRASERRCCADIRAAWRYLTHERGIPPERIVLFGRSLGGGPTADLAAEVKPGAVVLESTFLSAAKLGQQKLLIWPVKWLIRHRFDTESKFSRIRAPILVVHSADDWVVPFRHGKRLFELAQEPKQFLQIQGGHNTGIFISNACYQQGLTAFFEPLFPAIPNDRVEQ